MRAESRGRSRWRATMGWMAAGAGALAAGLALGARGRPGRERAPSTAPEGMIEAAQDRIEPLLARFEARLDEQRLAVRQLQVQAASTHRNLQQAIAGVERLVSVRPSAGLGARRGLRARRNW